MSVFVDYWGDPIEGSGWTRKGEFVERPKSGAPGSIERVRLQAGGSRAFSARSETAATQRPRYKPADILSWARPEDIELRPDRESPIRLVEFADSARSTIVNEVLDWARDDDGGGPETGGYVFGKQTREGVEITFATCAGAETERRSGSLSLDSGSAIAAERSLLQRGIRERLVGDYHSHPGDYDEGIPSPGDLRGWLRSLQYPTRRDDRPSWLLGDEVPLECHTGIIVARSTGSWTWPKLHVWITRVDGDRVVCERAGVW